MFGNDCPIVDGTGTGYSVLQLVSAFKKVSGMKKFPYKVVDRRPGDIAIRYGDPTEARNELGWTAGRGIEDMCRDSWRWQRMNPNGYGD